MNLCTCSVCGLDNRSCGHGICNSELELHDHINNILKSFAYAEEARMKQNNIPEVGIKNDQNKPDLSLVPTEAIFEMAKALTFGAKKYSRFNFTNGMDLSRPIAASLRHIYQFLDGQDMDEESQCHHLGNAMAGLAMAIWLHKNKPELDNRYKKS